MKKIKVMMIVFLAAVLLLTPAAAAAQEGKDAESQLVSVIFSHDMHSHMDTERITRSGITAEKGGFAKASTVIRKIQKQYPDSLLLDAGDFSMGTPYQTIYSKEAAELRMMGALGYDATTFGNHEFDYRAAGAADMLERAAASGDPLPSFLSANIDWDKTLADPQRRENGRRLQKACQSYGVKDYTVVTKGGVRIALFGILGREADEYAPESGIYFKDPVETARAITKQIQSNENADLIICLSHSGTQEDPDKSEDEILAEQVPDIDVIISGHTHTELPEPIIAGDTVIASCGSYTYNLGHMVLEKGKDGVTLKEYKLIPLDNSVKENPRTLEQLKPFKSRIDKEYFSEYNYSADTVLTKNSIPFTPIEEFAKEQGEDPLGSIIADSYIYAVDQAEHSYVDAAIVPAGVVRASFGEGNITAAHAFNVMSLGYGKDGTPGYPLVSAYLTGKELKAVAEVDATVSDMMDVARLYISGLSYDYNRKRIPLNRATDVRLDMGQGNYEKLDDKKMYRVVADLYSCQMLGSVKDQSFGLLSIEPKDSAGQPITNFEDHIIYDGKKELKAWYALASYLDSFDGNKVPDRYAKTENRKNQVNSLNPAELFKQPNKVAFLAAGVIAVLAVIAVGIVLIVRRVRKKRK